MIEILEMDEKEMEKLISRSTYGHLACSRNNEPYVVPIHFAYRPPDIYIYTTEGRKTEIIQENPRVCLQIEDVRNSESWESVIVYGEAEQLTDPAEREFAVSQIALRNPTLTPAVSIRWMDSWVRENIEVVLQLRVTTRTGRRTSSRGKAEADVGAGDRPRRRDG